MPGHYGPSGPASKRKKMKLPAKKSTTPLVQAKSKPTYKELTMARVSKNTKKKKLVRRQKNQ